MDNTYQVRWEIAGDVQLARTFVRLGVVLQDFREPLRRIADELIYPEIKHQFAAEGDTIWPAYRSAAYAAFKRRIGKPKLVVTGALQRSLTTKRARGSVYRLTKELLEIGTQLQTPDGQWNLGLIHQKGAPRANIQARPMMRLRRSAQTKAVEIFTSWFRSEGRRITGSW